MNEAELPVARPLPTSKQFLDLTGRRFARFEVIYYAGYSRGTSLWVCRCDCGTMRSVRVSKLTSGHSKSCGCLKIETTIKRSTKHGLARRGHVVPEMGVWEKMRDRCYNPKSIGYHDYGGRGITICDRWRFGENGMTGFACFYDDMWPRPTSDYQIERIKNDIGYNPQNCKWATRAEQCRNRRSNVNIIIDGATRCMTDWCQLNGVHRSTAMKRIRRGIPPHLAVTAVNARLSSRLYSLPRSDAKQ